MVHARTVRLVKASEYEVSEPLNQTCVTHRRFLEGSSVLRQCRQCKDGSSVNVAGEEAGARGTRGYVEDGTSVASHSRD